MRPTAGSPTVGVRSIRPRLCTGVAPPSLPTTTVGFSSICYARSPAASPTSVENREWSGSPCRQPQRTQSTCRPPGWQARVRISKLDRVPASLSACPASCVALVPPWTSDRHVEHTRRQVRPARHTLWADGYDHPSFSASGFEAGSAGLAFHCSFGAFLQATSKPFQPRQRLARELWRANADAFARRAFKHCRCSPGRNRLSGSAPNPDARYAPQSPRSLPASSRQFAMAAFRSEDPSALTALKKSWIQVEHVTVGFPRSISRRVREIVECRCSGSRSSNPSAAQEASLRWHALQRVRCTPTPSWTLGAGVGPRSDPIQHPDCSKVASRGRRSDAARTAAWNRRPRFRESVEALGLQRNLFKRE